MGDFVEQVFGQQGQAEADPEPTPEPQQEAPLVAEQPAEVETPVEQPSEQERSIPLPTFLDMRDARKAAERERDDFKRQLEEARAKPAQATPDPYDDPEGFQQTVAQQVQAALQQQKLDMSYDFAIRDHTKEAVETARQWAIDRAQADPAFMSQIETVMRNDRNPFEWIVRQHKRDGLLSDIGDNVDDWFVREAAKRGYSAAPAAPVAPVAAPPAVKSAPPRSIASDTAASASAPIKDEADFMAIFNKR